MAADSRIAEITLYARGARVRRTATIPRDAPHARIAGLPAAMIDDTLRISAEDGAVITAVHVGLDAPPPDTAADEESGALRDARRRAALATAEVERLDGALAALAAAPIALTEPVSPASGDAPPPAWHAVVEARRALVALRAERELALRAELAAARRTADEAHRALAAALDRDRRASSARPPRLHELRKHVDLTVAGTGGATVHLEYHVAAARWAPGYVARLDGDRAAFELRAVIAQATGEDWTGARIRLSTAEPERFDRLPELAAQRIGRRQDAPARAGFRAPPTGAAALYLDYLRSFPGLPAGPGSRVPSPIWDSGSDDGSSRARSAFVAPEAPPPHAAMAAFAAPAVSAMQPPAASAPRGAKLRARAVQPGMNMAEVSFADAALDLEPPPVSSSDSASTPAPPRLDYAELRMAPPSSADRGTLIPAPRDPRCAELAAELDAALAGLDALALPPGHDDRWSHAHDYAFESDAAVDVASDGAWHAIAVTAMPATVVLRHVAVPREQPDAFRIAVIANPLAGPLLPGPVDIYDRGNFLVTSEIAHTPPGATVEIGLGVDPAVKLARNTEFREETTGVLRGGLRLVHAITIDIDNRSERAIDLEVRERLPVTRDGDDEVAVFAGRVEPAWERWAPEPAWPGEPRLRGGHSWRLAIPPRTRRTLRASYEVRIAGKLELIGGNRRES